MAISGSSKPGAVEGNGVERNERIAIDRASTERTRAVDAAILAIEKQFGRGSIMKLGSSRKQNVDSIPTGSIALDLASASAASRGRITEGLRARVVRADDALPARPRRGPEARRRGRLHRRRARA